MELNTEGYQGNIRDTALIHTNDPEAPRLRIILRAHVESPIILSPRYLLFTGVKGRIYTRVVEIKAGLDRPLTLEPVHFNLEGRMSYRIEEVEEGRRFKLHLTNEPEASGVFSGILELRTNYDERPSLNIPIKARFMEPG